MESDYDNHDFDSWEPQPVDSNPGTLQLYAGMCSECLNSI